MGVVLLVGAGIFAYFIYPTTKLKGRLLIGAALGALLILIASDLDILFTIKNTLGFLKKDFVLKYLSSTQHGNAILLRIHLLLLLMIIIVSNQFNNKQRFLVGSLFTVVSFALLATFSWISHAATMDSALPILTDLIHFSCAAFWGGTLFYIAFLPIWKRKTQALVQAIKKLSYLGLASVVTLFATGAYAGLLHLNNANMLVNSTYGRVLSIKILLVLGIIGIAAVNRFYLLPRLTVRGGRKNTLLLRNLLKIEAILLIMIFIVTGILTTNPIPHGL